MPWGRNALAGAVLSAAALVGVSTAQAGVVVATSGPSAKAYPVGRKLADNVPIVLQQGDAITVLDQRGTRVLHGVGTYTLAQQSGPSKSATFAVLTRQRSAQRMRTGAVRAGDTGGPVSSPNLWYIDVVKDGTYCLPVGDDLRLWRATTEGQATYSLRPASGGSASQVTFADGDMLSAWNDSAGAVKDGASFVISSAGSPERTVSFRLLNTVPADPETLAQTLIENNCRTQLDLLTSALRVDGE